MTFASLSGFVSNFGSGFGSGFGSDFGSGCISCCSSGRASTGAADGVAISTCGTGGAGVRNDTLAEFAEIAYCLANTPPMHRTAANAISPREKLNPLPGVCAALGGAHIADILLAGRCHAFELALGTSMVDTSPLLSKLRSRYTSSTTPVSIVGFFNAYPSDIELKQRLLMFRGMPPEY